MSRARQRRRASESAAPGRPATRAARLDPARPSRTNAWAAGAALTAVFAVKCVAAIQLDAHPLLQPDAGLDTTAYVNLARRVLAGDIALGPAVYYVSPLYIYFLAAAYGLTDSFTAVRIVQAAIGALTVACVFVMAREWFSRRAAWAAATAAGLCGVLTFYETLLLQSALDGVLTAGSLTALTIALRSAASSRPSGRWLLLSGALFGLHVLNRPNVLLPLLVIAALIVWRRGWRAAGVLLIGLTLALAPITARNAIVAGEWALVASHGGLNFYIGNQPSATGLYQFVPGVRPDIEGQRVDTRAVAERAAGRSLTDGEVSAYYWDLAWAWIREEPGAALRLYLRKVALAFHGDHVALPYSFEFYAWDARTILRWLFVNPWLVMPIGLAGLFVAWPRERRFEFGIWASYVPVYAAGMAVFFVSERYRLPLFIPLFVTAGGLFDRVVSAVQAIEMPGSQGRAWFARTLVAVLAAFALVNWPVALADSREGDRLRFAAHLAEDGKPDEAAQWVERSAAVSANPAHVHAAAGAIFLGANDPARAVEHLRRAVEAGAADPAVLVDFASALVAQGRRDEAAGVVTRLQLPPGSDGGMRRRAGRVAASTGHLAMAERIFSDLVRDEPAAADAWAQLGFVRLQADKAAEAREALQQAAGLDANDATVLGGLAAAQLRLGRVDDARRLAEQALARDPAEIFATRVIAAIGRR